MTRDRDDENDERVRLGSIALVVVLLGACVGGALVLSNTDGQGPERARSVAAGPTSAPGEAATTTTTEAPPAFSTRRIALVAPALPARGIGVITGERVVLIDERGATLAEATMPQNSLNSVELPLLAALNGREVELAWPESPGPAVADSRFSADCATPTGDDRLRVARCGPRQGENRIDVWSAGTVRTVIAWPPHAATKEVVGHWAFATPSPDAKWVLATWSGECEVPTAFILNAATDSSRTVTGQSLSRWSSAPTSSAIGWTSDGRAVFAAGPSACGAGRKDAGVFAASPTGSARQLFKTGTTAPRGFLWQRNPPRASQ